MGPNFKMMGVTMGLALFSNAYLDTTIPFHVWSVRVIYGLSQLGCYGVLAYLYYKALHNTDPGVVTVKEDIGFGQIGDKEEKITVSEHDQRMCRKELQKYVIGTCITIFIHYKWGFFPPLLIQTITQPYNMTLTPLVKVTLLGQRAWGELRRPWQDPSAVPKQWQQWNDTIATTLLGEAPTNPSTRQSKKAAKKAAGKRK